MAIYKSNQPTKDGRQYYYMLYKKDFNGVNKKYKSKKYKTKPEAKEAEALFLLKRDNPLKKEFLIVAKGYFDEMYKIRKESSIYSYENAYKKNIEPYFKSFYITDIKIPIINDWKQEMAKNGFKLNYLNKLYNILKGIFDFAMKNYGLESNPVAICGRFQAKNDEVINDQDKIRYITYDQFNQFISVIDDINWKTFFIFLYYTGMRKGEVQALNWYDIDFENNIISVNKTLSIKTRDSSGYKITSTKNYINRKVKMNKVLSEQLKIYKKEMMKYTDFQESWFIFGCSRFMPQITIDRKKHYYFKLSDLEQQEITIHEFRHSHVSLLVNEYIKKCRELNIKIDTYKFFLMLANRMGHTVEVMQRIYMHLFPSTQDEIVNLLDNL